jgi:hypothetical protein
MTRILLIETAAPERVRKKIVDIIAGGIYPDPEITILCRHKSETIQLFSEIPGIQVIPLPKTNKRQILERLNCQNFDLLQAFWTTEKKYLQMKLLALKIRSEITMIDVGDGGNFRLTWKFVLKYCYFRLRQRRPYDYNSYVPSRKTSSLTGRHNGERILILQSAPPQPILRAFEKLQTLRIFRNPRYFLFCRNFPEIREIFANHPLIYKIWTHSETRDTWKHLRRLRRERFDGMIVFFTGDPSYWKIKYFAFLIGARHKIVFNENNDCFCFTLGRWLLFLAHRLHERWFRSESSRWNYQIRVLLFLFLKLLILPFRFIWLLLKWLWLRSTALWAESKFNDCSL